MEIKKIFKETIRVNLDLAGIDMMITEIKMDLLSERKRRFLNHIDTLKNSDSFCCIDNFKTLVFLKVEELNINFKRGLLILIIVTQFCGKLFLT